MTGTEAHPSAKRFWVKVEKTPTCWNWTGALNGKGYGSFRVDGRSLLSHRVAFQWAGNAIPEGHQVDHICHNRACVNPAHLRLVTNKQNAENRRGAYPNNRTSGIRGVTRSGNKWVARVIHHGKFHYGGTFETLPEAEAAAISLRNELFTHNQN